MRGGFCFLFARKSVFLGHPIVHKNKNSFEISEQNGTICRYVQVKKRKFQNKNHPTVWVLAE